MLMARSGRSAADAEAQLAELAQERGAELYTVAAAIVRTSHLNAAPPPPDSAEPPAIRAIHPRS
jgi:hypothetical protein